MSTETDTKTVRNMYMMGAGFFALLAALIALAQTVGG